MKFLSMFVLVVFGTSLLVYTVIMHEPPAFFAYAFGVLTGLSWGGIVLLWWLRKDSADDNDIDGSD